jgi:plasmid stabilization system protein ParE
MSAYRILSVAHQDIVEIWEYIARENLTAADRVIDEIYAGFDQITLVPRGGFKRTD